MAQVHSASEGRCILFSRYFGSDSEGKNIVISVKVHFPLELSAKCPLRSNIALRFRWRQITWNTYYLCYGKIFHDLLLRNVIVFLGHLSSASFLLSSNWVWKTKKISRHFIKDIISHKMLNIELYITPIAISSDKMNDLEGSKTFKIIVKMTTKLNNYERRPYNQFQLRTRIATTGTTMTTTTANTYCNTNTYDIFTTVFWKFLSPSRSIITYIFLLLFTFDIVSILKKKTRKIVNDCWFFQ